MPIDPVAEHAAAEALVAVIGDSRWDAVGYARAYLSATRGANSTDVARVLSDSTSLSMRASTAAAVTLAVDGFFVRLVPRTNTGSAANPITKMFPAAITESRFEELLQKLKVDSKGALIYDDQRHVRHGLADFIVSTNGAELPINVKNAGTKFENAMRLVGLQPNDCVPIPAYKAHAAVERYPSLIYAVAADYDLLGRIKATIPAVFDEQEKIVWELLNKHSGAQLKTAEDAFVYGMVSKYETIRALGGTAPFVTISARKSLRILHTQPRRTPGVGMKAWGTGAQGETNIHVSIAGDMTPWDEIAKALLRDGPSAITSRINKTKTEEVFDPEV